MEPERTGSVYLPALVFFAAGCFLSTDAGVLALDEPLTSSMLRFLAALALEAPPVFLSSSSLVMRPMSVAHRRPISWGVRDLRNQSKLWQGLSISRKN